jgi:hypothetical protein
MIDLTTVIELTRKDTRDDPVAYLAAADQAEEAGDAAAATLLRRKGETLKTVLEAVRPLLVDGRRRGTVDGTLPCGARFDARAFGGCARLVANWEHRCGRPAVFTHTIDRRLHLRDAAYLPRVVRQLFTTQRLGELFVRDLFAYLVRVIVGWTERERSYFNTPGEAEAYARDARRRLGRYARDGRRRRRDDGFNHYRFGPARAFVIDRAGATVAWVDGGGKTRDPADLR